MWRRHAQRIWPRTQVWYPVALCPIRKASSPIHRGIVDQDLEGTATLIIIGVSGMAKSPVESDCLGLLCKYSSAIMLVEWDITVCSPFTFKLKPCFAHMRLDNLELYDRVTNTVGVQWGSETWGNSPFLPSGKFFFSSLYKNPAVSYHMHSNVSIHATPVLHGCRSWRKQWVYVVLTCTV